MYKLSAYMFLSSLNSIYDLFRIRLRPRFPNLVNDGQSIAM